MVIFEEYKDNSFTTKYEWPIKFTNEDATVNWTCNVFDNKLLPQDQEFFSKRITRQEPLNTRLRAAYEEGMVQFRKDKKAGKIYW